MSKLYLIFRYNYWSLVVTMFNRYIWLCIHSVGFIAFICHVCIMAYLHLNPAFKETHFEERKLDKMDFPVVFKICFKPGFDVEKLEEVGYGSVYSYFSGQSKYNKSVFGWAGHLESGGVFGSVEGKGRV